MQSGSPRWRCAPHNRLLQSSLPYPRACSRRLPRQPGSKPSGRDRRNPQRRDRAERTRVLVSCGCAYGSDRVRLRALDAAERNGRSAAAYAPAPPWRDRRRWGNLYRREHDDVDDAVSGGPVPRSTAAEAAATAEPTTTREGLAARPAPLPFLDGVVVVVVVVVINASFFLYWYVCLLCSLSVAPCCGETWSLKQCAALM